MNTTFHDWINAEAGRDRLFAQEQLIVAVAEHIWERMEQGKTTKADIASALGKSKAYVTQVLNGTRNMTLRTLSDIAFALDARLEIQLRPKSARDGWMSATSGHLPTAVVCERKVQLAAGAAVPQWYAEAA